MGIEQLRRAVPVAVFASVLLVVSRAPAENEAPFPCEGRWQGRGQNTGFPTAWTIDMVVHAPDASGSCGTIEYTNPACGGVMVQCAGSTELRVREKYTHGQGQCAPPGELVFSCDGDRMKWEWRGWEVVHSTLQRVGPPPSPAERPAPPPESPAPPGESTSQPGATPPSATPPGETPPGETPPAAGRCGCEVVGGARAANAWWLVGLAVSWVVVGRRRRFG